MDSGRITVMFLALGHVHRLLSVFKDITNSFRRWLSESSVAQSWGSSITGTHIKTVALLACNPSTMEGRDKKDHWALLVTSLALGSLRDPISRHQDSNRARYPNPTLSTCLHPCVYKQLCPHTRQLRLYTCAYATQKIFLVVNKIISILHY